MKRLSILTALAVSASSSAHAAGFYTPDIGVRAFSRGGAFVAGADDLTAQYYNPAALTRLERPQIMLNLAGVQQFMSYQRMQEDGRGAYIDSEPNIFAEYQNEAGYYDTVRFPKVTNKSPAFIIPHFGFSSKFGTPKTTFAFGFYPPYAPDFGFDKDGPQRYSLTDTMVIQTALGPTVAHRFNDWISVGVGVAWSVMLAERGMKVSVPWQKDLNNPIDPTLPLGENINVVNNTPPNEDPNNDVGFSLDVADWGGFSWNVGLLIEPPKKRWAFGLMVQPPIKFSAKGTIEADFSGHILATEEAFSPILSKRVILSDLVKDNDVTLNVTMPLIIKTGFAFRPTDTSEIEIAGVWQNWSSIEALVVTDLNLVIDVDNDPLPLTDGETLDDVLIDDDVVLPTHYRDAWSIRLGGQNHFGKFTARAGVFYESSAMPTSTVNVSSVDANKFGYGVGGSYRPNNNWSIDVGISQLFFAQLDVTDSVMEQVAVEPISGDFVEGTVVGNGTYKSSGLIFGGGLNYYFGG